MAATKHPGNITTEVKGDKLVIEIDLSANLGQSKSGKSLMVGTTSGFKTLSTPQGDIKLSLNCIK